MLAEPSQQLSLDDSVRAQLEMIETALLEAAQADSALVTDAARHIISAGGKRFRPLLVVLASQFGTGRVREEDVVRAAVVVELTHVASLYHDDVMDEARLRRGSPSANARWGNTVAILVGDLLFARASDTVVDLGPDFVRIQARTFSRLVQGQIAETVGPHGADPLDHYLQVVADKTGSLIATSATFGAKIAGVDPATQAALAAFGEEIGIVFQLSDDIIDITSDETGKTPGTDLREGIPTLPTLLARRSTDPGDERLRQLLDSDLHDDAALAEVLGLLRAHRCIDEARAVVRERAERARSLLQGLPTGEARDALEELCDTRGHPHGLNRSRPSLSRAHERRSRHLDPAVVRQLAVDAALQPDSCCASRHVADNDIGRSECQARRPSTGSGREQVGASTSSGTRSEVGDLHSAVGGGHRDLPVVAAEHPDLVADDADGGERARDVGQVRRDRCSYERRRRSPRHLARCRRRPPVRRAARWPPRSACSVRRRASDRR